MHFTGKYYRYIFAGLILFSILTYSCVSSSDKKTVKIQESSTSKLFKIPEVPSFLNKPELRADFLLEHYWDNLNFNDTTLIKRPDIAEQAFVDFIQLLLQVPSEKADKGVKFLMSKAEINGRMFRYFLLLAEKYLYDPKASTRNEALYEFFLKAAISSNMIDDVYKIRPQKQYDLAQKNKPGQKAADFKYTLKNGTSSKLYSIQDNLLLLYFHNPGCQECKKVREQILSSSVIQELTDRNALIILAIYPDENLTEWEKYYAEIPETWINGYNKGAIIKNKELYDLKAIPTLYLLDKDKNVLLKDAKFEDIEAFILNN